MQDELARLPGVGNVLIFGSGTYAMRIWLDPQKMFAYSLNPSDVLNAISHQNKAVSAGQIAAPPTAGQQAYQFTVNVPGQLANPEEFANIIIKSDSHYNPIKLQMPAPVRRSYAYVMWDVLNWVLQVIPIGQTK